MFAGGGASVSVPTMAVHPPVAGAQLDVMKAKICECVSNEPAVLGQLADYLRGEDLITPAVQKAVKYMDGKNPYDKAGDMISPAIERVRGDPGRNAPALVRALTSVGLGHVTTVSSLTTAGKLNFVHIDI